MDEDLMKEHGILSRIMLIYDKCIENINNDVYFNPKLIYLSAFMIRKFIEDHHEKTEEIHIFPVLINAGLYVSTVNELIKQHKIGRIITSYILKNTRNLKNYNKNNVCNANNCK